MIKQVAYNEIKLGDKAQMKRFISAEDVKSFAEILDDNESFHVSDEAARLSPFGKKICHGMHVASYISELVGKTLPGFGTIYCSQVLNFKNPLYLDSNITVKVEVMEKLHGRRLRLLTIILDDDERIIIDGEAIVMAAK